MAQKLVFVDDITDEEGARPFLYAVEGVSFEIDLAPDSVKRFYEAVAPFVAKSRRTSRNNRIPDQLKDIMGTQTTALAPAEADPDLGKHTKEEVSDCKAWLERFGVEIPGARLPVDMWHAWRANDPGLLKPERLKRTEED